MNWKIEIGTYLSTTIPAYFWNQRRQSLGTWSGHEFNKFLRDTGYS